MVWTGIVWNDGTINISKRKNGKDHISWTISKDKISSHVKLYGSDYLITGAL